METNALLTSLAALTADLQPTPGTSERELATLKKELAVSLVTQPLNSVRPNPLPAPAANAALLSAAHLGPLEQLATEAVHASERQAAIETTFQSYERTLPLITPHLDGSVPEWARGTAVDHTLGPFVGADGIKRWFDFYPIFKNRQVNIFISDPARPILVLTVRESVFFPAGQLSYSLAGPSVWIAAASLTAGLSTVDAYAGIRVKSGKIEFSKLPTSVGNDFQIDNTTKITLTLVPDPVTVTGGAPAVGLDASNAALEYFSSTVFEFLAGKGKLSGASAAKFTVYGSQVVLGDVDPGAQISYLDNAGGLFIPFQSPTDSFAFQTVLSPFCSLVGELKVLEAGWFLPVSLIGATGLAEASGTGELGFAGIGTDKISWKGLEGDGLKLEKVLLLVAPGLITLTGLTRKNPLARQKIELWEEDDSKKRFSSATVSFAAAVGLTYTASSQGIEILSTVTSAAADIDRPIAATGVRLRLVPRKANFYLVQLTAAREVLLFDAQLLNELTEAEKYTVTPVVPIALRNAFFVASQPEAFILAGSLIGDNSVATGTIGVLFGIFEMFLTLPDPYVTSQPLFSQRNQYRLEYDNQREAPASRRKLLELMCFVHWPEPAHPILDCKLAPVSEESFVQFLQTFLTETLAPDSSASAAATARPAAVSPSLTTESFQSLPLSQQFKTVFENSGISREIKGIGQAAVDQTPEPVLANEAIRKSYGDIYRQLTASVVSAGQVLLLDVSGNADQLGVSFNYTYGIRDRQPDVPAATSAGGFPFQAKGVEIIASGKNVRAFTLPHIQWEPVKNIQNPVADPPTFPNPVIFANDGGPATLASGNPNTVALEPRRVINFIEGSFNDQNEPQPAAAYFTLPFGMLALAFFSNRKIGNYPLAAMDFNRPRFSAGPQIAADVRGGIQLKTTSLRPNPNPKIQDPYFYGFTLDTPNLGYQEILLGGVPTLVPYGMLGGEVGFAFNQEFFFKTTSRVPLRRIDFSGYGASIFSEWLNPDANFGLTSQAKFNVLIGRTAHEVVQIKSIIYPWGVPVVRTITIQRTNNARVTRYDSGWQAQGPGIYDFSYKTQNGDPVPSPYTFHPGIVRGIYNVREIRDTNQRIEVGTGPAIMDGVWFDCDAHLDFVVQGAVVKPAGTGATLPLVPSRQQFGFVLIGDPTKPEPLSPKEFRDFLQTKSGPIGGPVDCVVDIGGSGQLMRISRIDVDYSNQPPGDPEFVTAARGTVVLPKDGAWSVTVHDVATDQVTPVDPLHPVPLIREGKLDVTNQVIFDNPTNLYRIADPADLSQFTPAINEYGFLQTTGTQKLLFRQPGLQNGVKELQTFTPALADAYRLVNSKSVFPNIADCIGLPSLPDVGKLDIIPEGLKFKDSIIGNLTDFTPSVPNSGRFDIINTPAFKIYILYGDPSNATPSSMSVDLNSAPTAGRKNWATLTKDVSMVVDLGPFSPLLTVTGQFDAAFGRAPGFTDPKIVLNDALQKIKDILQLIATLSFDPDYLKILKEGMQIAMSNSADSWDYKFHAVQEIPVLKFPSLAVEDAGPPPLKLQASLSLGFYFNETLKPAGGAGSLLPSSGAFVEFFGQLSVMVLSIEIATIYAIGTTTLKISSDTTDPAPALDFNFGFGAEIVVQLPVIAKVSVSFIVSIAINLQSGSTTITAGFIYKGVADILDGLVVVTIFIEAHGSITPRLAAGGTSIEADVTFGLDISIFLVIDINFTKTWQETRQIA
jgi:hypothetical protein